MPWFANLQLPNLPKRKVTESRSFTFLRDVSIIGLTPWSSKVEVCCTARARTREAVHCARRVALEACDDAGVEGDGCGALVSVNLLA